MKSTILEKIIARKRERVEEAKSAVDRIMLLEETQRAAANRTPHRLREALSDRGRINIIAEFKRASPSKGVIAGMRGAGEAARSYELGGAAAVSVLTEEDHFNGSLNDLKTVRHAIDIPVLRKDFIFDPFQVYEAAAAGADAILLIAAALGDSELEELEALAEEELGMDVLIEVHTDEELARVGRRGAKLIGVNNRDLHTFDVSLDVSRRLIKQAPAGSIMVSESGITTKEDLVVLRELGFSGFLIGETLMRSGEPTQALRQLNGQG